MRCATGSGLLVSPTQLLLAATSGWSARPVASAPCPPFSVCACVLRAPAYRVTAVSPCHLMLCISGLYQNTARASAFRVSGLLETPFWGRAPQPFMVRIKKKRKNINVCELRMKVRLRRCDSGPPPQAQRCSRENLLTCSNMPLQSPPHPPPFHALLAPSSGFTSKHLYE